MAAKGLPTETIERIVAEWRTGQYSQQNIADKHNVSKSVVNKYTKGVPQDLSSIVTAGVQYRQGLADHDDRIVTAVTDAVDERTKHIQFFNNATLQNLSEMTKKIGPGTSIMEHRQAQEAIAKGRETVLGRAPENAIQINNNISKASEPFPIDPIEAARRYAELMK